MQEMREMQVQSRGEEDPLEEEMATHSSILARGNPTDRGAWRATVHGVTRVRHDWETEQTYWIPQRGHTPPLWEEQKYSFLVLKSFTKEDYITKLHIHAAEYLEGRILSCGKYRESHRKQTDVST